MSSGVFATVRHHGAPLGKALFTQITLIRSLPCVCYYMPPKRSRPGKSFQANFTLIIFLTHMHRRCMHLQTVNGRKFLAALSTQKRLRVHTDVTDKIVFVIETFRAIVTLKLFGCTLQNSMNFTFVGHQGGPHPECVATSFAYECLLTGMTGLVVLQVVVGHETLLTLVATVTEVALMYSPNVQRQGDLVKRGEPAQFASSLDFLMDLLVIIQRVVSFKRLVANVAFERPQIAMLEHVAFVSARSDETQVTRFADGQFFRFFNLFRSISLPHTFFRWIFSRIVIGLLHFVE